MFSILFFPAQQVLPDGVLTENPLPASLFSSKTRCWVVQYLNKFYFLKTLYNLLSFIVFDFYGNDIVLAGNFYKNTSSDTILIAVI